MEEEDVREGKDMPSGRTGPDQRAETTSQRGESMRGRRDTDENSSKAVIADDAHSLPPSPLASEVRALPPSPEAETPLGRERVIGTPSPKEQRRRPAPMPAPLPDDAPPNQPQQKRGLLIAMVCVSVVGFILVLVIGTSWTRQLVDDIAPPPHPVSLVQPQQVTINNTLPIGGVVVGTTETVIGAQSTGAVQQLFVKQGDQVKAGQKLAVISVYGSQDQAQAAQNHLDSAQAELSDLQSMSATDKNGTVTHARTWLDQERKALVDAQQKLTKAQKDQHQAQSEQSSAQTVYNRVERDVANGTMSPSELSEPKKNLDQANKKLDDAKNNIHNAALEVQAAQEAVKVALDNVSTARNNRPALSGAPSAEQLRQAEQRVHDAQQAVDNAGQAKNNVLTAPFDGVVKQINSPVGTDVGDSGVLTLDSNQLIVRAHVDQNTAQKLKPGQDAMFSAPDFSGNKFNAKVAQIGAALEPGTETIAVDLAPEGAPDWLRIGENVNGNVILSPPTQELVVPASAVANIDGQSSVFTMSFGRAIKRDVVLGQPAGDGVAVKSGVEADDRIVDNANGVKPGDRIQTKS